MSFCTVAEAIFELKQGKMIILIDDENRENEGDLVFAAEKTTPDAINFMTKYARGLVCLSLAPEMVERLNLPMMTSNNESRFGTNFTVSIEARCGVTTGISAFDRATTILTAISAHAKPEDIVTPGHIFPLRAADNGVFEREGQTEGSVDLMRIAGLKPAAVICEIMSDDGSMARLSELKKFAKEHQIKIISIKKIIQYRQDKQLKDITRISKQAKTTLVRQETIDKLPTVYGDFSIAVYGSAHNNLKHVALIKGPINPNQPILVRIHSECLTGDVFGSLRCDCGNQLENALEKIALNGQGVLLYLRQEGRGIGLSNKISAYALQDQGFDTVEANERLGFPADLRDYKVAAEMLLDLGIDKVSLLTNNPDKVEALVENGIKVVERVPLEIQAGANNLFYLQTKKKKMGHLLKL